MFLCVCVTVSDCQRFVNDKFPQASVIDASFYDCCYRSLARSISRATGQRLTLSHDFWCTSSMCAQAANGRTRAISGFSEYKDTNFFYPATTEFSRVNLLQRQSNEYEKMERKKNVLNESHQVQHAMRVHKTSALMSRRSHSHVNVNKSD